MMPPDILARGSITACGGCKGDRLKVVLDLGDSPLADDFPTEWPVTEFNHPLQLVFCRDCSLLQLGWVVPDEKLWSSDYGFFTGSSPALISYYEQYAQLLLDSHLEQAKQLTVEIACNDGTLLQHFRSAGG